MYSHLARPRVVALVFGVATACADDASSHESEGDSESFDTAEELPTSEAISSGTDDGGTSSSDADTSTTGQTTTAEDSTTASSSESTAGEPDPELCLPPDAEQGVTWARGYSSAGNEEVVDVAAHPDGGVIAVGFYSGTLDFGDSVEQPVSPDEYPLEAFVAKYTATGELVWLRVFVGSGGSDMAESVAVSDAGHVLVVGGFSGTVDFGDGPHDSAGQTDGFLVELDGDSGEPRWVAGAGMTENC